MTLRTGHGKGAGVPRVEVMPPDELPAPIPGVPVPLARRPDGTVADSASARALGARGGRRSGARARLVSSLGLAELAEDAAFLTYRRAGDAFVSEHLASLATQAGGSVGPGPSSIVASAGVQLAASRFFSDRAAATCDASLFTLASSLANASRQNLLAAYELAVREAKAEAKTRTPAFTWGDEPADVAPPADTPPAEDAEP
jgi:hypothetical protein